MTTEETIVATTALASKRVVYVGGLAEGATVPLIRAAMIPFGPIQSVDIPMDYQTGQHKGFAFVEFEDADDAEEAIFNMDGAELLGRFLKVSLAQENQMKKLTLKSNEAIWKSDDWFQDQANRGEEERKANQADAQTLTE